MITIIGLHIDELNDLPVKVTGWIQESWEFPNLVKPGDAERIAELLHYSTYFRIPGCTAESMYPFHLHIVKMLITAPDDGMRTNKKEDLRVPLMLAMEEIARRNYRVPARIGNTIALLLHRHDVAMRKYQEKWW
jgi:hypothetical protein